MNRHPPSGRFQQNRGRGNFRGPPVPSSRGGGGGYDGLWRGGAPSAQMRMNQARHGALRPPFRVPQPMRGGRPMMGNRGPPPPFQHPPSNRGGSIPPPPPNMRGPFYAGRLNGRRPSMQSIGTSRGRGPPPPPPFRPHANMQLAPMSSQPPPPPPPPNNLFAPSPPPHMHPRPTQLPPTVPAHPVLSQHHAIPPPTPQPSVVSMPAPPTTVSPSLRTPAEILTAWSEFTSPTGLKYYYNAITKENTYEKPAGFVSPVLGTNKSSPSSPAHSQSTTTTLNASKWVEYTDAATGKKYYSNGITTTWENPNTEKTTISTPAVVEPSAASKNQSPSEPVRKKVKREIEFSSKEEAIAAFKGLLIAKDVAPTLKWNELLTKAYSTDPRWTACEDALTTGERKQALAEYQTKRANELRQLERQEKLRAREAFMKLLTESLPKISSFSPWNTHFDDVRDSLSRDDRFHAVATEEERAGLFLDFCEEFRKREERRKRNLRKDAQEAFLTFLREKEEAGVLTFASTWNSFASSLSDDDRNDSRYVTSTQLSDSERQLFFADFVIELQSAEDDKRRRIRDARRRAERAQQDAFTNMLTHMAKDDETLYPWSRWKEHEEVILAHYSYGPLREQNPEAPRQVFEDFVRDWNQKYRRDRALLVKLTKPTDGTELAVDDDTSYAEFSNALLDKAAKYPGIRDEARGVLNDVEPVSSAMIFFKEMQGKVRARTVSHRGSALRRGHYDSSEDEGEIVEEGSGVASSSM